MNKKEAIKMFPSRISTTLSKEMEAKSLEEQLRAALEGKEPIKIDQTNLAYTERKNGVMPMYDIRTDRWEIALKASTKVNKSNAAKRMMADHPELYEHDENGNMILDQHGMGKLIKPTGEA